MQLYNKIYKAVNEGISKALLDNNQDVSINYTYKKIDNKFDMLDIYLNNFLNSKNNEECFDTYNKILECYQTIHIRYNVKNYDKYVAILQKMQNLYHLQHYKIQPKSMNFNIDWIDFQKNNVLNITGIDSNGNEYAYDDIDKNCGYLKISNKEHTIIIDKYENGSYLSLATYKFSQSYGITKTGNYNDTDGFNNTVNLLKNIETIKKENIEDFSPVLNYLKEIDTNDIFEVYMPALGELKMINDLLPLINQLLKKMDGNLIQPQKTYWSSTIFNIHENYYNYKYDMYCYKISQYGNGDYFIESTKMDELNYILPLFKKIKG